MQAASRKTILFLSILSVSMILFTQTALAQHMVKTEKDCYQYGEKIKVLFSSAPGKDRDWICIVPAGSPNSEPGDYQYMPGGISQGFLTFDSPSRPGKYEVRAYYNYIHGEYMVTGRYPFTVLGGLDYEKTAAPLKERRINPNNPLEANVPPGNALIYIFSYYLRPRVEAEIKANGKTLVFLPKGKYFQYSVPAKNVTFKIERLIVRDFRDGGIEEVRVPSFNHETTYIIMPGHVYYFMVSLSMMYNRVDHIPHEEGADIIETCKLTQLKK